MAETKTFKPTWTEQERQARINLLITEVKTRKKLLLDDFYRFALINLKVSKRIIDTYLRELELYGIVKHDYDDTANGPIKEYIVWAGEKTK